MSNHVFSETAMGKKIYAQSNSDSEYVKSVYRWVFFKLPFVSNKAGVTNKSTNKSLNMFFNLNFCCPKDEWHYQPQTEDTLVLVWLCIQILWRGPGAWQDAQDPALLHLQGE